MRQSWHGLVAFSKVFIPILLCFFSTLASNETSSRLPDATIQIPMRDGFELPASVYFPDSKPGKYPCILIRQPLGRDTICPYWIDLVQEGYVVVVQSTRSCLDATGKSLPYLTDGWKGGNGLQDGYDTVQWLAKSNYSNGKIATIGESATGITQLLLAPTTPPNLVCQYIEMAAPCLYSYVIFPGGQLRKEQVEGWLGVHKRDPLVAKCIQEKKDDQAFWNQFNVIDNTASIQVPQVHVGGWYDIFLQGTIDAFCAVSNNSKDICRKQHKLIIGPWGHRWRHIPKLGEFELPVEEPPSPISFKRWFDFYLKGIKNDLDKVPRVQYYVMGPFDGSPSSGNCWKCADKWPLDTIKMTPLYLACENKLLLKQSLPKESIIDLLFDPENPVPTIGGRNLFIPDGPRDLRSIEGRKDVLLFTSELLEKDFEVTGRVTAKLHIQDATQERDVCLRIADVYPDGKSILILEGTHHLMPQKANTCEEVTVDLWSTSMVFAKGHKIRLIVSGSNFPAYEKSLEVAKGEIANSEVATTDAPNLCFRLLLDDKHPSCVMLPVVSN